MYHIDTADSVGVEPERPAATGDENFFSEASQTIVPAWILNMFMNELSNVVTSSGLELDKLDDTQVLQAINLLVHNNGGLLETLVLKNDITTSLPESISGVVSNSGTFGQPTSWDVVVPIGAITLSSSKTFSADRQYLISISATFLDQNIDRSTLVEFIYDVTTQDSVYPVITLGGTIYRGGGTAHVHVHGPKSTTGAFMWQPAVDGILNLVFTPQSSSGILNITANIYSYNAIDVIDPNNPTEEGEAKSVIFDITDNYGGDVIAIRSIEFYLGGILLAFDTNTITAYSTTNDSDSTAAEFAFITSCSKIGVAEYNEWIAESDVDTRLIVVFDSKQTFDKIVINNTYVNGIDCGAKNVRITASSDEITDITFNASVASSTVLNDTEWPEHINSDEADDRTVYPAYDTTGVKTVIFDIENNYGGAYMGVRSIEFYYEGTLITLATSDFTAYGEYGGGEYDYGPSNAFNTSLSKTGSMDGTSWRTLSGNDSDIRLIIVFNDNQLFDEIRVNNYHDTGLSVDRGVQDVKITTSTDTIVDTIYGSDISNGTELSDSAWPVHNDYNEADDQPVWVI